jgi:hypothetical protein
MIWAIEETLMNALPMRCGGPLFRPAAILLAAVLLLGITACSDSPETSGQRIDRTLQEAEDAAEQMRREAETIADEARREAEAMSRIMEESAEDALDRAVDAMREPESD